MGLLVAASPARAESDVPAGETVVGTLVRAWPEHRDPGAAAARGQDAPLTFVRTSDGAAVRLPTEQAQRLPEGATVAVTVGDRIVDVATSHDGLDPARQVLSAGVVAPAPAGSTGPAPSGTAPSGTAPSGTAPSGTASAGTTSADTSAGGTAEPLTDEVTVAMAVPAGGTQDSTTLQQVVDQVNGPVADFWSAQSHGALRIGVAAQSDWFQLSVDCSDPFALWSEVARHVGWTRGTGRHLMVYLPRDSAGCAYGLAEVGRSLTSGGQLYVTDVVTSLMAHELGHNFGLGHSSELQCDGAAEAGACRVTTYADYYDVMGASWDQVGSLNAAQAARLGFLPDAQQQAVDPRAGGGTYTLAPYSGTTGIRALKLVAPDGSTYWLEYRVPSGQDAWLGSEYANWLHLDSGVLLRRASSGSDTSLLLDGSPSPQRAWSGDLQEALQVGRTVVVGSDAFAISVTRVSAAGATVTVTPSSGFLGPAGSDPGISDDIGGNGSSYFLNDAFGGRANRVFAYGAPSDRVFVGDWDGDGTDTLMVRRGNVFYVRNSNSSGVADFSFSYGNPGDTIEVGDWDGDGVDTLAVRRGNRFYIRNSLSSGIADSVVAFGNPDDTVLVGDWDGDGKDSFAVRRGAQYLVKNVLATGAADQTFTYGAAGDVVLVGRWSAAQTGETLCVRRGSTYYVRYALSSGIADRVVSYGDQGDVAFAGDWNGDGIDTLGVRRLG